MYFAPLAGLHRNSVVESIQFEENTILLSHMRSQFLSFPL